MLAHLRRVVPRQAAAALRSGLADAIMAHWGVVTPELAATISGLGKELYVWTIDDVPRLLALDGVRVTGVITNERDLFTRAAAARIRGSRAAG
jgi:glycerophosphoryl diester phosphodiesterase